MVHELLYQETRNSYFQEISKLADQLNGQISLEKYRVLTERFRMDRELQKVVPTTVRYGLLYHARDYFLAGHPGGR